MVVFHLLFLLAQVFIFEGFTISDGEFWRMARLLKVKVIGL